MWHVLTIASLMISCASASQKSEAIDSRAAPTQSFDDQSRPWRSPDYSGQERALGYNSSDFVVPIKYRDRVQFWVDIYTQYSVEEGIIHDSENLGIIYERVDLKPILRNPNLSAFQKEKAQEKLLEQVKEKWANILKKLDGVESANLLNADEMRIWLAFAKLTEKNKFLEASKMSRLRFQQGLKERTQEAIFLSGRYLEDMEKIFREVELPLELTRMVFVESSFNVFARSKVGASGLWQVMPYTGRGKVVINKAVDKRNHPMEATRLAAKILAQNYRMLESWPLAVTGYNHGPYGIRRLSEKNKTKDLFEIIDGGQVSRSFGFASRNFYVSFLAALEVEKNANLYFSNVAWSKPLDQVEIPLSRSIYYRELLGWFDGDDKLAQTFNPHILHEARKNKIPIPRKTLVNVPSQKQTIAMKELATTVAKSSGRSLNNANRPQQYKVEKGDTLTSIARQFRVSIRSIMEANDLPAPHLLRAGQVLTVPD